MSSSSGIDTIIHDLFGATQYVYDNRKHNSEKEKEQDTLREELRVTRNYVYKNELKKYINRDLPRVILSFL